MDWNSLINGFRQYISLEKGLSNHTRLAYVSDLRKLEWYFNEQELKLSPIDLKPQNVIDFIIYLNSLGIGERSQARMLSSIRAFFKYLLIILRRM